MKNKWRRDNLDVRQQALNTSNYSMHHFQECERVWRWKTSEDETISMWGSNRELLQTIACTTYWSVREMELAITREESGDAWKPSKKPGTLRSFCEWMTKDLPKNLQWRNLVLCECITKDLTQKLRFCPLYRVHTLYDGGPKCFSLLFLCKTLMWTDNTLFDFWMGVLAELS